GFTDSEANIAGIAKFVESLHAVREVELVPYHRFGQHKYEMLGREYLLSDAAGITEERLKQLSCILAAYGLNPVVGG
ncbi:MAG: glycyl-radical enzyme activating protein, partial [Bacillota bacterium]